MPTSYLWDKPNKPIYNPSARSTRSHWWATIYSYHREKGVTKVQLGHGSSHMDIYSFSMSKTVSSAEHTLSLEVLDHSHIKLRRIIRPNAIVEFWVSAGDGTPEECFLGVIDRVGRSKKAEGGGKVHRSFTIACRGFTKALNEAALFYAPTMKAIRVQYQRIIGLMHMAGNFGTMERGKRKPLPLVQVTPPEAVLALMTAYFPGRRDPNQPISGASLARTIGMDISVPNPQAGGTDQPSLLHVLDVLDCVNFVAHPDAYSYIKYPAAEQNLGQEDSIWTMCRNQAHKLFNEFFVDVRPDNDAGTMILPSAGFKSVASDRALMSRLGVQEPAPYITRTTSEGRWAPRLIHRPRPYSSKDMLDLPYHLVYSRELVSEDVGYSDADVKNFFQVYPRLAGTRLDQMGLSPRDWAIFNFESWVLNGPRVHTPDSDYVWPKNLALPSKKSQKHATMLTSARKQAEVLAKWYYRNDEMLNGVLSFPYCRTDIRLANGLSLMDEEDGTEYLFYIEGKDMEGVSDAGSSTNVTVVRGMTRKEYEDGEDDIQEARDELNPLSPLSYIRKGSRIGRYTNVFPNP